MLGTRCRILACLLLGPMLAGALGPRTLCAHEIPSDVTVRIIARPAGDRLQLLVRAPLEAMQDIEFPTVGPGYLDFARADRALRDAATVWLANDIAIHERGRRLEDLRLVAARASIPSDRSFTDHRSALEHVLGPPLPEGTPLVWQQALLDALFEVPIESERSELAIRAGLERLGLRVVTVIRFVAPDGAVRILRLDGDEGLVPLDPSWRQAAMRFVRDGFLHILDGTDHLLFLLCLIVPCWRRVGALVLAVTAFTAAHSVTLAASAYGLAPDALWFPPLVETLIAASIFYMALENVVSPAVRMRWAVAFGFGLVHGFGLSFALRDTLQFAGDHVLASLLSFNLGVELGQLAVLAVLVPALHLAFRHVVPERLGVVVLSVIVGHTAWHWMAERFAVLREFPLGWSEVYGAVAGSGLRWLAAGLLAAGVLGLTVRRIGPRRWRRSRYEAASGGGAR